MAIYKVPTSVLEACKKELSILSTSLSGVIQKKDFDKYINNKKKSKERAKKLIKLLEENYDV